MSTVVARAPGRVNLIGEHTDTTFGLCLPIAIDHAVEITYTPDASRSDIVLTSDTEAEPATIALGVSDASAVQPAWARYVAGVVQQVRPAFGGSGHVASTLPAGVGLSSSAALEVACALAFGADAGDPVGLARLCQAAEHAARGVPTGLLDQLASITGVAGHAVLLDCRDLTFEPVPLPSDDELEIVVVPGAPRWLEHSGYADRLADLHRAEAEIGPLRDASVSDIASIGDSNGPSPRASRRHGERAGTGTRRVPGVVRCRRRWSARERQPPQPARRLRVFLARDRRPLRGPRSDAGRPRSRILGAGWGGAVLALSPPRRADRPRAPRASPASRPSGPSAPAPAPPSPTCPDPARTLPARHPRLRQEI